MKKIAIGAAAMGGAALIAFGASGTFAELNDVENATLSAGAGSLNLEVGGGQVATAPEAMKLQPGQATQLAYWVNNAGDTNGSLSATIKVLADKENWCNEPERVAEGVNRTVSCDEFGGEFDDVATVKVLTAPAANQSAETCSAATGGTAVANVPQNAYLSQANNVSMANLLTISAGKGVCVVIDVALPREAGNLVQGDSVDLGATLTLTQI